ncbi:MAG TPA: serine--tRNA ligase [Candidatus Moranbacteria bacterium]|nr:serine--tRNA ligase [Candidatus Moranbacteria bacterium]
MLDIKFVKENKEAIKKAIEDKNIDLDLEELLQVDKKRVRLLQEIESLQAEKNKLNAEIAQSENKKAIIAKGSEIKKELARLEPKYKEVKNKFEDLMVRVPTIPSEDTPVGKDDADNVEIGRWGDKPKFDFKPKTHIEIGKKLDILDLEKGAKVGGYRGYYLKNEGVSLVMGVMMYAVNKMIEKGFAPMIPPTLVKEFALFGSGYFKGREYDGETDEIYQVATSDKEADGSKSKEKKFLVGTAEPSLLAYYSGEVLEEKDLPVKVCGYSQCYRSEIGSYGKDTKGMYRVHEFMKVEQVVISKASIEESDKLQKEMVAISREMHEELGLPYRVLQICTGDMGAGKYKMFDLEAWMPGLERWGETGSASNFLDWQARRLNVKYKDENGNKKFAYLLNNTALPSPRIFIAILENYQQADGSVIVPEVLRKWMPGKVEVIKSK